MLVILLLLLVHQAIGQDHLPPWDNQTFDWSMKSNTSMPVCSDILVHITPRRTAIPVPTPPFFLWLITEEHGPMLADRSDAHNWVWRVQLPPMNTSDSPPIMYIEDLNGISGGAKTSFYPTSNGDCPVVDTRPVEDGLKMKVEAGLPLKSCDEVEITVEGGNEPYKLQVYASGMPTKTTYWSTNRMVYPVDLASNSIFYLVVRAFNGNMATKGPFIVSDDPGAHPCLNQASTITSMFGDPTTYAFGAALPSKSPDTPQIGPEEIVPPPKGTQFRVPMIVGVAFSCIAFLVVVVALMLCLRRKRKGYDKEVDEGKVTKEGVHLIPFTTTGAYTQSSQPTKHIQSTASAFISRKADRKSPMVEPGHTVRIDTKSLPLDSSRASSDHTLHMETAPIPPPSAPSTQLVTVSSDWLAGVLMENNSLQQQRQNNDLTNLSAMSSLPPPYTFS